MLVKSCLALLGSFSMQQRSNTTPLIQAVLHDGGLENLIFCVAPNATFSRIGLLEHLEKVKRSKAE